MSKKNSPKFPPLESRFLPAFVNMYYIKRTTAGFFLSILLSVTLHIENDKSFPHAVFCKSSVHILSMFSVNKILFLITGSGQNNSIFPPTQN